MLAGCLATPGPYREADLDFGAAPTPPGPAGPDGKPTVDPTVEPYIRTYLAQVVPATGSIAGMKATRRERAFIGTLLHRDQHYGYLVCVDIDVSASPGGPATAMQEGVIVHDGKVIQWLKGGWWWEKNLCDPSKRLT
jgi:hypothetical protein